MSDVDELVYEPPPDYRAYEAPEPTIDTPEGELKQAADDERFYTKAARGRNDVVISGPMWDGWGPGRYFRRRVHAYVWARAKYGPDRVVPLERQTTGRWAYLIRGLKKTGAK